MNRNLEDKLNNLWGSTILKYEMDLFRNILKMKLKLLDGGSTSFHTLIIKNISTVYFLNDIGDFKYIFPNMKYLELTSIAILDEQASIIYHQNKQNNSRVNMFLEIWSQVLFIETDSIEVDGLEFKI